MSNIKIYLLKLLGLLIILIAVDFLAGVILGPLFNKQKSGKYLTTTHALTSASEDILIFGNSHASEHFNTPLMKKELGKTAFNFGNQGQSIVYTYTLLKSILSYHKPKVVIIDIDYDELRYDVLDYQKLSIFLPYRHQNAFVDSAITMVGDNENLKAFSALYRYNSTIGYMLLNTYKPTYKKSLESLGYDPILGNICQLLPAKAFNKKMPLDTIKIKELINLIGLLQAQHIQLLVTTTPLYHNDDTTNILCKTKLDAVLSKMNVNYLDYGNSAEFRDNCELFNDYVHLNATGADIWTHCCIDYLKINFFKR